jgi:hypothetical protein
MSEILKTLIFFTAIKWFPLFLDFYLIMENCENYDKDLTTKFT